jgi:hypothetical protein
MFLLRLICWFVSVVFSSMFPFSFAIMFLFNTYSVEFWFVFFYGSVRFLFLCFVAAPSLLFHWASPRVCQLSWLLSWEVCN